MNRTERVGGESASGDRRRDMALVAVLGLCLRLGWVLAADVQPRAGFQYDMTWYDLAANRIAQGHGLTLFDGTPTAGWPPGYPAFLGALYRLFGSEPVVGQLANAVLGTLTCLLAYALGARLFGRTAGLVGGLLLATYPDHVFYSALLLSEIPFTFVFLGSCWLFVAWSQQEVRWPLWAVWGASLGLATLLRGTTLAFPLVAFAVWLVRDRALLRVAPRALAALIGFAAVLAPWAARNAVELGAPVLVSTSLGRTLHYTHLGPDERELTGASDPRSPALASGEARLPAGASEGASEVEIHRREVRETIQHVLADPFREIALAPRRAYRLYWHGHSSLNWGRVRVETPGPGGRRRPLLGRFPDAWLVSIADIHHLVLLALALCGIPACFSRRRPEALLLPLTLLYVTLLHAGIFHGNPRFHVPLIPFFCILAALPIVRIAGRVRRRGRGLERAGAIAVAGVALLTFGADAARATEPVRDLRFFLRRLRTLDHLPALESSHTAMFSTWDRRGGNFDGHFFDRVEGDTNVLLDVEGPGCIHRISTGRIDRTVEGTRIQIFLDRADTPVLDLPVAEFFRGFGPVREPVVDVASYPSAFLPIPYAKHARVQLVSEKPIQKGPGKPKRYRWGAYWQIVYTTLPEEIRVESLRWPPREEEERELEAVRRAWRAAEDGSWPAPKTWSVDRRFEPGPGEEATIALSGRGEIREIRVAVVPAVPEVLEGVRMQLFWDGSEAPSVDVPLGSFFGHGGTGHAEASRFDSILLGVTEGEAYARFPMPFESGATLRFENRSDRRVEELRVRVDQRAVETLPRERGRFHATWVAQRLTRENLGALPTVGPAKRPAHVLLDRERGPGKYVGALLRMSWPFEAWWGEGDWLVWSDEDGWPPSYHGTGTEEYFHSGYATFDRKAVSGIAGASVAWPGAFALFSFHLNDAFQFRRRLRVALELEADAWPADAMDGRVVWDTTAYWYAFPAQPAHSRGSSAESDSSR